MNAAALVRWLGDRHEVEISIPLKTVSEANQREHWAPKARRAAQARMVAKWSCSAPFCAIREGLAKRFIKAVTLRLERISPRGLDDDNLRGALKNVRDGVTDALGLTDDSDARLRWEYGQRKGKPKEYGVLVTARGEVT